MIPRSADPCFVLFELADVARELLTHQKGTAAGPLEAQTGGVEKAQSPKSIPNHPQSLRMESFNPFSHRCPLSGNHSQFDDTWPHRKSRKQ